MSPRAPQALAAALAALALQASAQAPPTTRPPVVIEVEVDVVSITAVIHDKAGRFASGLGPKDIHIFEDGVPQDVTIFREAQGGEEKIPLSVGLVLDASGSMAQNMGFLREAASSFVGKLEEVDEALVIQFNESVKGSAEFTGDIDRLDQFIAGLQAWGGTSLYDAIRYSLERIKDRPGRKALVVFSDGEDTTSSITESEVVDYARAVEATIYGVGIRGGPGGGGAPRGFLKKIAEETGGQYFFPDKVGELIRVFAAISAELHRHYLLAYSPKKPPDGLFRKIEVRLDRKDLEVRVRKGYFAVKKRRR
ncbi:MAG TPA: VWA domain-containing protein [Vicinamibacteria bacterium]|nr:VWA domain-containing protein [Vicinamibacteria bacterium]